MGGPQALAGADLGVPPHVIEEVLNHRFGHRSVAGIYNRSAIRARGTAAARCRSTRAGAHSLDTDMLTAAATVSDAIEGMCMGIAAEVVAFRRS